MKVVNCGHCGKLMLATPSLLCGDCLLSEREQIMRIKAFMSDHPTASLMDVVQSTGVPFRTVRGLMAK